MLVMEDLAEEMSGYLKEDREGHMKIRCNMCRQIDLQSNIPKLGASRVSENCKEASEAKGK